MKRVYRDKKASAHWSATRNKECPSPRLINRLQTTCQPLILFPHSVYIRFPLFVLLERRSGDVSSMPWGVRGSLVSWANCSVGVLSCPRPRPAAPPCAPTRPARGMSGFWIRQVVLLEIRSGDLSSMPWRVRGTLVA